MESMKFKSLLIGVVIVLTVGVGAALSVGSQADRWVWDLAPKIQGYVPDPKDVGFYYPLPEVVEFTSPYGYRTHPLYGDRRLHAGLDLGAPEGMPVLAAHAGYVTYANWSDGYGQLITLEYADGKYETRYAHLSEIFVKEGETVRPRQVIGKVGSTGGATGPHLHFELRRKAGKDFVAVDPAAQIKAVEAYVSVRPSDLVMQKSGPQVASKSSENHPSSSPLWQAPALNSNSQQANQNTESPVAHSDNSLPENGNEPNETDRFGSVLGSSSASDGISLTFDPEHFPIAPR